MTRLSATDSDSNIDLVIDLSNALYPNNTVLAQLSATQAILEGGLRTAPPSKLALEYCNLFGIKGKGSAGSIIMPTQEFIDGQMKTVSQQFAYNSSVEDSLQQHKDLLELDRYSSTRAAKTFEEAAVQIRLDGYATDPKYTQLLIDVYNECVKE